MCWDGSFYGIQIFQPDAVLKRQREFMRTHHPFVEYFNALLCFISAFGIGFWYCGIHPETSKLIALLSFLVVLLVKVHHFKQYDKQAEYGMKRV